MCLPYAAIRKLVFVTTIVKEFLIVEWLSRNWRENHWNILLQKKKKKIDNVGKKNDGKFEESPLSLLNIEDDMLYHVVYVEKATG